MKTHALVILSLALGLSACGDSGKKDSDKNVKDKASAEQSAPTKKQPDQSDDAAKSNPIEKTKMTDQKFRDDFAAQDGVQSTQSGLLYKVLASGDAAGTSPSASDIVTVHYRGTLTNGTQFDSSYDRGETIEFGVGQVIPGWTEILQLMKPGDKWQVVIPSELGYGDQPVGTIPAGSTLVFDIELISFISEEAKKAAFIKEQTDYLAENAKKEGVTVKENGMQVLMTKENASGKTVNEGDVVTAHMMLKLTDGTVLTDSRDGSQPIQYPVDQVFEGWALASKMLKTGEAATFVLPANLAFGDSGYARGGIPPFATIILGLEVVDVKSKAEIEAEEKAFTEAQAGFITDYLAKHSDAVKTESGLVYRVITEGTGNIPTEAQTVKVHYSGTLINGEKFDSSYDRGRPAQFPVNGVIRGWIEGLQLMKEGSKYELVIPADLAYGPNGTGSIPGGATLVFTVELLEIL